MKPPWRTEPRDGRRHDRDRNAFGDFRSEPGVQVVDDRPRLQRRARSLLPRLELNEIEGVIAGVDPRDQAEADDGIEGQDAFGPGEQRVDLARDFVGALDRGGWRKLDIDKAIAVVLFRQEARGQSAAQEPGSGGKQQEDRDTDDRLPNEAATHARVPARRSLQEGVEPTEDAREPSPVLAARAKQHGGQSRRQRQRVERGDHHGHGDRDRELLIEAALNARHEADRHEHRGQNQRDRDDRAGHLLHRCQGRLARAHAFLDVPLHRFDDDDRIVDDQADREHEPEQRQRVDREAEQRKHRERADERHRHRERRDEGRAPVLQEHEDDQDDERERCYQRLRDLFHPLRHGQRVVQDVDILEVRRKLRAELAHRLPDASRDVHGVRSRYLKDAKTDARLPIHAADLTVGERPQLDARDVAHSHHRPVGVRTQHDRAKLVGCLQPALRADRVRQLLAGRARRSAELPRGVDGVLLLNGVREVGHGQAHRRQTIGLDPDPHRVVVGAEDEHLTDAGHTSEPVDDVDVGVVGEEQRVVGVVGRAQRRDDQRQTRALAHREAELVDLGRQVGLRLCVAILNVDLIDVRIGLDVERHRELHRSVVRVRRLHVEHVVDAVHLLLEGRGDGLFDRHCVRTGVGRLDDDLRRDDVGKHRNRQSGH